MSTQPDLGNRTDPHAQARAARQQPLLLHSVALFREILEHLFTHRHISTVVEVGVESGQVSSLYAELGAVAVHCVEPDPTPELRAAIADNDALHLAQRPSPAVLAELPIADLYVLDGDHNYATVRAELDWITANAPDAVVVLHDLLWPCARRDMYYEPSNLDPADRHPATTDGPTVGHDGLTPSGFIGRGAFTWATHAGGERNGVLTAVEDALAAAPDWHLELIPAVFGLGIMLRPTAEHDTDLLDILQPYSRSTLLTALENNRIALYTRVIELEHEAAAHATNADELASTIAAKQAEIDALTQELNTLRERHANHTNRLTREKSLLAEELEDQRRVTKSLQNLARAATSPLRQRARPQP
ncbi:class I SAM-dependent methyltransferase [Saccharopolyspora sp. WRP15-2]|uniref:Class I SAM-dependent methyltransferase n=1 Tax=Saccharopolyspora oryzae TaxID=2997343 RepID=A0ABT4UVC5_9PSEU|nr:class I SAM-dependent methyltransferase [Saccharopolyspora oryzae]MDA3625658.1 class I SAM-dependent methyltransferase [Saccharopolyspora oryzae]